MAANRRFAACGVPGWIGARNDTVAYINDILLGIVNGSTGAFAFLSNLAIIVAIVKTPPLQKPSNILLCGLAFTDCLSGITTQPLFVVWRFVVQGLQYSCSQKALAWQMFNFFNVFTVCLSFSFIVVISFDRHRALSRPLEYRANATKKGALKAVIITGISLLLFTFSIKYVLQIYLLKTIILFACGVWFFVLPIVNHIRMLFAIRRHNSQIGNVVDAQQMVALSRREKKVALDMFIVSIILSASLMPLLLMVFIYYTMEIQEPRVYATLSPWAVVLGLLTASINPLFYLARNPMLKTAVRSVMNI